MTDTTNTGAAPTSPAAAAAAAAGPAPANTAPVQGTDPNSTTQQPTGGDKQPDNILAGASGQQANGNPAGDGPKPGEGQQADPTAQTGETEVNYDNLKLPDGVDGGEVMTAFKDIAKDLKLPPEQAQKITDLGEKLATQIANKNQQAWVDLNKQWENEVRADPTIGGQNFDKMRTTIGKALDQYGDAQTRQAFILTGAGNNPAIIKFLYGMAQAVTESGGMVRGNGAGDGPKSIGQTLYPNMKS